MLFGSKSEKVLRQIEQLELQLEELQAAGAIEGRTATAAGDRPVAAKPFRRPLPEHLATNTWANRPGPASPRSMGRDGAGACMIRSQASQLSLGRTWRMTLKQARTYSRGASSKSCLDLCAYPYDLVMRLCLGLTIDKTCFG